jgi:para-aminobenzoate synthetase/4-amino-4-deoxychorismate lyase
VGSAVVWDSKAAEEWRECAAKCRFLTTKPCTFELFESILWNKRLVYKIEHITRLKSSAFFFDYPFDKNKVLEELACLEKQLTNLAPQKARLFLNKNGSLRCDFSALGTNDFSKAAKVAIAPEPIDERNPLMFHKTTERPWFTNAAPHIDNHGLFDLIFKNSNGEITEGSRSNIFIRKGTMLFTPPIGCGLLGGVLRQNLIRRGKCKEAILRLSDLKNADAVYCGNSVRGLVAVELDSNQSR